MIDVAYFSAFFLVFLRILTFFVALQVLFPSGLPNTIKVSFCAIIAFFIVSSIDYSSVQGINNWLVYMQQCTFEVITGLVLGYLTNLAFICGKVAGSFMDIQIGFSMMSIFDPTTQSNETLMERILAFLSIVVFLVIDGHHVLIRALIDSYNTVHIGTFVLWDQSAMYALHAFIQFFIIAIKIAMPIVIVLIITDIVMGLVSRTVPQLNVMILGMPVKILLGFSIFMLILPVIVNLIINAFSLIPDLWRGFYNIIPAIIIFASEEKTEQATPKKKSDARKKGQVAKSKEVALALTLAAATMVIVAFGNFSYDNLRNMMFSYLNTYLNMDLNYNNIRYLVIYAISKIALIFLFFALPVMILGVIANYIQAGFIFTTETLKPDFKKLNPISGFKKIFSTRTLVELFKDIIVITVVGFVGYSFIRDNIEKLLMMNTLAFTSIPYALKGIFVGILIRICIIMLVIAIADYIYQRFMHNKELKMTKQEIKEEFKQDEGNPEIKSKRKQRMKEMSAKRMMAAVPEATVVVTNPTHIAVALKYSEGESSAPLVTAKGVDRIALKIKEIAKENHVPIVEDKPLARLIYEKVDIDKEIPMDMYQAVAEILALVYKMKK
ncbi:fused FliR family export protein/FlhB family type III secretion system protein [Clostridium pasteurianum]|uniref:fused FliR family export protein/FlhB family type III secretion system protein n=1 Tax=Clostridium pasteurianum TaxID=1501 RepID=UPI002260F7A5|nr:fused FliR family export protein/FlhB family type III secretion system protein [Clostridium pasteurianum]UZW16073.1 fused FliR family export protein/FlhB family type III secretion system protein [Clostridium pasteurianum]